MLRKSGWFTGIALVFCCLSAAAAQDATNTMHADPAQLSPPPAHQQAASPALWKVQGPHETIYLFGTVHVLRPDVQWQTKKFSEAFSKSDALYLEVAKLDDMAAVQPLIMQLGMDAQHPLSTKITAQDNAALDKAVKAMGMPGEQMMEPMQPWMAYLTLSVLPMVKAGYSPTAGVDVTLAKMAKDQGKPVMGFETMDQQLHYLADLPQAQQVTLLHDELADLPDGVSQMNQVVSAWEKGDVETIAKYENQSFSKSPELFKRLVVERNSRFADELATLLASEKPGTVFVAIGAAHLAGPDSVQKDLEAKGYKVTRE